MTLGGTVRVSETMVGYRGRVCVCQICVVSDMVFRVGVSPAHAWELILYKLSYLVSFFHCAYTKASWSGANV